MYNDWLMSAFNIFFVSLPVLALGCFDQDISQTSCLRFPQLYKQGQDNACFTWQVQVRMSGCFKSGDKLFYL